MRLRRSGQFADNVVCLLAESLGFCDGKIFEYELDWSREQAFKSADADEFALHYLHSECLSKYSESELPDAEAKALALADEQEDLNRLVSQRDFSELSSDTKKVLLRACTLLEDVLKPITGPTDILPYCDFGPGATAGRARKSSALSIKWQPIPEGTSFHYVTNTALPYVRAFVKGAPHLNLPGRFTIVPGDTVTTVPKSWKIRRTINCQPSWNLFFQKGLGGALRHCARSVGLLYPNAQDVQRRRSREGSITGQLATVDLSNASASITCWLLDLLVEGPVRRMVYDLRASQSWEGRCNEEGKLNPASLWAGGTPYSMVSTMGNGFTFELETILFWAITAAAASLMGHHKSTVTVFGDDIICPSNVCAMLVSVFADVGLRVNTLKSFWEGPFRESCGGHYWKGEDVTPFYLKESPEHVGDFIRLHNKVLTWLNHRGASDHREFTPLTRLLRRETSKQFRGPYGLDGCLWSEWDACAPTWDRKTQSYRVFSAYKSVKMENGTSEEGRYNAALYSMLMSGERRGWYGNDSLARSVSDLRYRRDRVLIKDSTSEGYSFEKKEEVWRINSHTLDRDAWDKPKHLVVPLRG